MATFYITEWVVCQQYFRHIIPQSDCGVDFFVESSESYRKPSFERHWGLLCHQTSWISAGLLVISLLQSFIVLSQA